MSAKSVVMDGNTAAAHIAYRVNDVCAIFPITPSSTMAELADAWAAQGVKNIWGQIPVIQQMQSEGGAAGAVHGALQSGALTTTFTASQGFLLMLPNMYKIAGELTPCVFHVAARAIATQALSIFGDHSDVMSARMVGFAMLAATSVQEAHDLALVAQVATLESRVPVIFFFDGFRTSHEESKISLIPDEQIRDAIDDNLVRAHRARGLTPERPVIRGTAHNPDTFFQARESANPFYARVPDIVQRAMDRVGALTGRPYRLFRYSGHPEADRAVVVIGSAFEVVDETVAWLNAHGERVGVLHVSLYRPWDAERFLAALPSTVKKIAVLDRTKEIGALGEPLYLDVVTTFAEAFAAGRVPSMPVIVGGRYGLSSKDFDPAMAKAVFDELKQPRPKHGFTVGINDDVTHTSLSVDASFDLEAKDVVRALFFGLGADGTVGANKNSIKIIGEQTDNFAQGYFVYDSKKSGATTISHLRFGPRPIRSTYLIRRASFVACHQWGFLDRFDMLDLAAPGAVFLLNAPYTPSEVWLKLPREVQQQIVDKDLRLYVMDAYRVARELGLGQRINTLMQTAFFAISGVLPRDEAIVQIKRSIEKSYGKKGHEVVQRNFEAVDRALAALHEVPREVRVEPTSTFGRPPVVPADAPELVQRVTAAMLAGRGDLLPVSAFPIDGTWPLGTSRWEKRNIALEIPVWDPDICIQCNKCALVCPHATIRAKVYDATALEDAPATFRSTDYRGAEHHGSKYTIQVAPEDCTGCGLCVQVCPAKDKSNPRHKAIDMQPQPPLRATERENWSFFLHLPPVDRAAVRLDSKGSQLLEPLFEYSGACAGCGETPYLKLLTQLFGDRALIANATGCSSIYGGNLPTTPYTTNRDGRGPAWSNSLFEDNAEFGFGLRLGVDNLAERARLLLAGLSTHLGDTLVRELLDSPQETEAEIAAQRARVEALRRLLSRVDDPAAKHLDALADYLVRKSVWLVGGDGWAYDIGFGGLDHVLAQQRDVNVLVLDTEVYSNTGGQASKATPLGAAAKFAVAGKTIHKKDLGLEAMSYGHVYVARIAFGAKDAQTVRALVEADSYRGPSLVIAYSHCIAHGYDMRLGAEQQKLAVDSGVWPLYRFDPRRVASGEPPLKLDSGAPRAKVADYMRNESRFRMVEKQDPLRFKAFLEQAQQAAARRIAVYRQLAGVTIPVVDE
jgi:pyruvate-ferredoxin/flavodoxin oxidoreductase